MDKWTLRLSSTGAVVAEVCGDMEKARKVARRFAVMRCDVVIVRRADGAAFLVDASS